MLDLAKVLGCAVSQHRIGRDIVDGDLSAFDQLA